MGTSITDTKKHQDSAIGETTVADNKNGWDEYQKLVLTELKRHNELLHDLDQKLNDINVELATLKVKSGIWGVIGGLIPVLTAIAIYLFRQTMLK